MTVLSTQEDFSRVMTGIVPVVVVVLLVLLVLLYVIIIIILVLVSFSHQDKKVSVV